MGTMEMVRNRVAQFPAGKPFSIKECMQCGKRAAVDQAFARLVRTGLLSRPARGVYVRPKTHPLAGELPPDPFEVAGVIAGQYGGIVQVHGAEAARRLGFSTQVPVRPIFQTNGPGRRFRIGQMEITLRHVSPRKLALTGSMAGVALAALWHLGRERVTPGTIEQVRKRLVPAEFEKLRSAAGVMPGWMLDAFAAHEGKLTDE
ncbi:MAG: hypothetical protein EOM66_11540 [Clostridia bacterium]|nr:hypothetical protein [Clostridia bacterium]